MPHLTWCYLIQCCVVFIYKLIQFVEWHPQKWGVGVLTTDFEELFNKMAKGIMAHNCNFYGGDQNLWMSYVCRLIDMKILGKIEFNMVKWKDIAKLMNRRGRFDLQLLNDFRGETLPSKKAQKLFQEIHKIKLNKQGKTTPIIDKILKC
eukprot:460474_1